MHWRVGESGSGRRDLERVSVSVCGGLGNSLFIVCAGYAYARRHDCPFVIQHADYSWGHCSEISPHYPHGWPVYWDTVFREFETSSLENEAFAEVEHWDPQGYRDLDELVDPGIKRVCLSGYYQNPRFFHIYQRDLARLLRPAPADIESYIDEHYGLARGERVLIIGVRQSKDYGENGWWLPPSYYRNAWRSFVEKTGGAPHRVLAIADEPAWVSEHLAPWIPNLEIVDETNNPLGHHGSVIQFYLMLRGTSFILSNSTFHWWGAYLADTEWILSPENHCNPYRVYMPKPEQYFEVGDAPPPIWRPPSIRAVEPL